MFRARDFLTRRSGGTGAAWLRRVLRGVVAWRDRALVVRGIAGAARRRAARARRAGATAALPDEPPLLLLPVPVSSLLHATSAQSVRVEARTQPRRTMDMHFLLSLSRCTSSQLKLVYAVASNDLPCGPRILPRRSKRRPVHDERHATLSRVGRTLRLPLHDEIRDARSERASRRARGSRPEPRRVDVAPADVPSRLRTALNLELAPPADAGPRTASSLAHLER